MNGHKSKYITGGKVLWALPLVFCVALLSHTSLAQSGRDYESRLNRLENDINTLSRAVYRGEDPGALSSEPGSNAQADTEIRLQQLESQLRQMTGRLEELSFENRQLRANLERVTSDIMLRMQDIEQNNSRAGASNPSNQVFNSRTSIEPQAGSSGSALKYQDRSGSLQQDNAYAWQSETAKRPEIPMKSELQSELQSESLGTLSNSSTGDLAASQYEQAFSLLKSGQYDQAEAKFSTFLSQNPDHVLSGNAKYWLGETYYVRGSYDEAARIFAEGYQKYPKGAKAPDNLLKLGLSLASLGSANDACLALTQLEKEFPNGAGPVLRRAKQEKSRLGC